MFEKSPLIKVAMLPLLLAVGLSCSSSTDSDPTVTSVIVERSECGGYGTAKRTADVPTNQTCIEWDYSIDGILTFTHYSAGFNCCTDVTASFNIESNIITVQTAESGDWCHCLCLFDMDYNLGEVSPGIYSLALHEPYLPEGDTPITFVIEIDNESSGTFCVERSQYPWEITSTASGGLIGDASCKSAEPTDSLEGMTCLEYSYDGSTLSMTHYNAVLNCCPVLVAEIEITNSEIIITEIDSVVNGGCDCYCRYDLMYEVTNLPVGEYFIQVVEPLIPECSPVLQDTVNLYFASSGVFCVSGGRIP